MNQEAEKQCSNEKRPYIVTQRSDIGTHQVIVMAHSKGQAIRHVAEKILTAKAANGTEVFHLMRGGICVEVAGGGEQLSFGTMVEAQQSQGGGTGSEPEPAFARPGDVMSIAEVA